MSIREDRINRREELTRDWETLIRAMKEDPSVTPGVLEGLSTTFMLASRDDSLDIRVMEDCVSRIRELRSGDRQDLGPTPSDSSSKTLEDFLRFSRGVGEPRESRSNGLRHMLLRSQGEE